MNPGKLDRKIIIQRQAPGLPLTDASGIILTDTLGNVITTSSRSDSYGQELDAWGTWRHRWAMKIEQKATESEANARKVPAQPTTFKIRYTPGLTSCDRIAYKSKVYDIVSIIEMGRRQYQQIDCVYYDSFAGVLEASLISVGDCVNIDDYPEGVSIDLSNSCIRYDLSTYLEQSDDDYIYYSWESPSSNVYYVERLNKSTNLVDGRIQAALPRPVDLTTLDFS